MNGWDNNKLEEMTKTQNPYTKTKINYTTLAQNYTQIIEKLHENGDVIPLAFKDVEIAYNGKIDEQIKLSEITDDIQEKIDEKENKRQVMHIKHFSRSISHQEWYNYLDEEINDFIKKYPEYSNIIL